MLKRFFYSAGLLLAILIFVTYPAKAQDLQNFTISSFTADYYINKAADGVPEMRVKEKIIADFPNYNQNHGILRALPQSYDNHDLELKVNSITKSDASSWNYSTYTENSNLVLKVGDKDKYVHGLQEYNLDYSVRGIANQQGGLNIFWNVNGSQWQQQFDLVVANVHLPADIAKNVIGEAQCFTGQLGSTMQNCQISEQQQTDGGKLVVINTTQVLQPGETLSYKLNFADGTFANYTMSPALLGYIILLIFLGLTPGLTALIFCILAWKKHGRDPKGKGVIVPQYLPPKQVSVLGSSEVLSQGFAPKAITATILDLAVRHYIKIYETGKKFIGYKYDLELTKAADNLHPEELKVIEMIFGSTKNVGKKVSLDDLNESLYLQAQALGKKVEQDMTAKGYFVVAPRRARLPWFVAGGAVTLLGFVFMPYTLGLIPAGLIILITGIFMSAPSQKGAELKEYLLGLKDYMKLAEADRLKVLQSPSGELTEKIDVTDKGKLVKLYEKLLPYAVLFGIESDWAQQFANLYKSPPDWYVGAGTFNAIYFAGAISSFGNATVASFSPPSGSGISGAGGGGGGGGGGGW